MLWRRGAPRDRGLLCVLSVHAFACVLAGGDWMPAARLLVPVLPLYAICFSRAVVLLSLMTPLAALNLVASLQDRLK